MQVDSARHALAVEYAVAAGTLLMRRLQQPPVPAASTDSSIQEQSYLHPKHKTVADVAAAGNTIVVAVEGATEPNYWRQPSRALDMDTAMPVECSAEVEVSDPDADAADGSPRESSHCRYCPG